LQFFHFLLKDSRGSVEVRIWIKASIRTRHLSDRVTCLPLDNDLLPVMAFDRAEETPEQGSPLKADSVGRQREIADWPTAVESENLVLDLLCFPPNLKTIGFPVLPECPPRLCQYLGHRLSRTLTTSDLNWNPAISPRSPTPPINPLMLACPASGFLNNGLNRPFRSNQSLEVMFRSCSTDHGPIQQFFYAKDPIGTLPVRRTSLDLASW
jgi:hypothetical protein